MEKMHFEHIGVAVRDINESLKSIRKIFAVSSKAKTYKDTLQNVKISFADIGGVKIELIEPLDINKKSPVDNLIKNNTSYYHLCYSVVDIENTMFRLMKNGAIQVMPPVPAVAYGRRRVAFLFVRSLGLIELVEKRKRR